MINDYQKNVIKIELVRMITLHSTNVTVSGKSGLMAYVKVSRKAGFKYFKCYLAVGMCTNFSTKFLPF